MTQVDFYILPDATEDARWVFACRLIDKVQRLGHSVLVALDNKTQARAFDELLWTFKPESFIPHQLVEQATSNVSQTKDNQKAPEAQQASVEITYTSNANGHHGLLVNLSSEIPSYFSRFERLSEIVIQAPQELLTSRERFSFYKSRGYPIETRKI